MIEGGGTVSQAATRQRQQAQSADPGALGRAPASRSGRRCRRLSLQPGVQADLLPVTMRSVRQHHVRSPSRAAFQLKSLGVLFEYRGNEQVSEKRQSTVASVGCIQTWEI